MLAIGFPTTASWWGKYRLSVMIHIFLPYPLTYPVQNAIINKKGREVFS